MTRPCAASLANLKPNPGGEIRNPKGNNQWTYRAEAEKHLAAWCSKYGRELIEKLLDEAKRGNDRMMKLALDRILPAVKEVDLRIPGSDPAQLADGLAAFATRSAASGSGNGAAHPGANGNGGVAP